MNTNKLFERKKPKGDLFFKGRVWNANDKGKDLGTGNNPILVGPEYIWFSKNLSVPIYWVKEIYPVGSGFFLKWHNEINKEEERAVLCVRTFFGYNIKKRDEIIQAIRKAKNIASPVAGSVELEAELIRAKGCEKCGNNEAKLYDFILSSSIGFTWQVRTERLYLCNVHARKAFKKFFRRNTFFGFFGLLGRANVKNAQTLYEKKVISLAEFKKYKFLSFIPIMTLIIIVLTLVIFLNFFD